MMTSAGTCILHLDAQGVIVHVTEAMQALTDLKSSDKGRRFSMFAGTPMQCALNTLHQDTVAAAGEQTPTALHRQIMHSAVSYRLQAAGFNDRNLSQPSVRAGMVLTAVTTQVARV